MDGAAYSSLIGLPALVIPSGFTTSSALAVASLPHKLMDVLSLLCRWRSCALRVEPNWPLQWKVASCVPRWALVCASGISVLCHQLRELLCSPVSICWAQKVLLPSHSHMDPKSQVQSERWFCPTVPAWQLQIFQFACFPPMERSKWWSCMAALSTADWRIPTRKLQQRQCQGISSVFFKWLACLLSGEKFTLFQTDLYFQPCIANSARRQYLEAVNGLIAEPIFQVSVGDRDDRMTNGGMFQLGANQKFRIRCLESQKAAEHLAFAFKTIFWGYGMY